MKIIKIILVFAYSLKIKIHFRKKIKRIAYKLNVQKKTFNPNLLKAHDDLWNIIENRNLNLWYKVYSSVSKKEDIYYVPEDIYYSLIEPCLNNKQLSKAYADKNFYDLYYGHILFPDTLLRNIDEIYFDKNYNRLKLDLIDISSWGVKYNKIIIKPSLDSGGGKGVELFNYEAGSYYNKDGVVLTLNYLNNYNRNFIIQPYIEQHPFFKQFNIDSVNTIRVLMYRSVSDDNLITLHALLRAGRKGSHVDNQASGGLSCGINRNGILNKFAIDKNGTRFQTINDIDISKEIKIPFYNEVIETALEISKKNIHCRLLGFDFCIDSSNHIKIIEINSLNNEINFYQMNNGPLFGDYTLEVIKHCSKMSKTFVIDFDYKNYSSI